MSELESILEKIGAVDGVKGVILLSGDGKVIASQFSGERPFDLEKALWVLTFKPPEEIGEMELIYEKARILIRRPPQGYLLVWMSLKAQLSMVKLNCDVALSALAGANEDKGLFRFFGKGKK